MATTVERAKRLSNNNEARLRESIAEPAALRAAAESKANPTRMNGAVVVRVATGEALLWPDGRVSYSPGANRAVKSALGF